MWAMFNQVASNIGSTFEIMIIFIAFFGGIIFFAKGFQVGITINFVMFAGIFMWFYQAQLNWGIPLIIDMICLVVMALSFYPLSQASETGGIT